MPPGHVPGGSGTACPRLGLGSRSPGRAKGRPARARRGRGDSPWRWRAPLPRVLGSPLSRPPAGRSPPEAAPARSRSARPRAPTGHRDCGASPGLRTPRIRLRRGSGTRYPGPRPARGTTAPSPAPVPPGERRQPQRPGRSRRVSVIRTVPGDPGRSRTRRATRKRDPARQDAPRHAERLVPVLPDPRAEITAYRGEHPLQDCPVGRACYPRRGYYCHPQCGCRHTPACVSPRWRVHESLP